MKALVVGAVGFAPGRAPNPLRGLAAAETGRRIRTR
jgi:hypothetical protein